jgi:ketol-acid reductoisomerase
VSLASAAARPTAAAATRTAVAGPLGQQIRGVKTIDFAGTKEEVYGAPFIVLL